MRCVGTLVAVGLVVAGCVSGDDQVFDASPTDAPRDGGADAAVDARPDGAVDARPDAAVDAGPGAITFSQASYGYGVRPANMTVGPDPLIEISNQTTTTLSITFAVDAPFSVVSSSCDPVLPGRTCTVSVDVTPSALGAFGATLTASAPGYSAQASLTGTAEGYVAADLAGAGKGAVTGTPTSADCNGACFPGGTQVTFTATASTGSTFAGWSDPSCGTSSTCTVTAGVDPQTVTATFEPIYYAFEVEILGDAFGEVSITQIDQTSGPIATCTASCSALVNATEDVEVAAATPAHFAGWGATCASSGQFCDAAAGTASVTVTFDHEVGEQDLFFGTGSGSQPQKGIVYSADYDAAGDLIIGTSDGVHALSPTLTTLWTSPVVGEARVDASGDVFVLASTGLYKLDSAGNQVWVRASAAAGPPTWPRMGHVFAPTPSGGVVVDVGGALEIWGADGALVATPQLGTLDRQSIAVDSAGLVYAGVESSNADSTDLEVFDSTGTRRPDFGQVAIAYQFAMVIDSNSAIVAGSSGHSQVDVHRVGVDHTDAFWNIIHILDPDYVLNAVATNSSGDVASVYSYDESTNPAEGIVLRRFSPTGTVLSSLSRPGYRDVRDGPWGLESYDVAVSPTGHVAVVGRYLGITAYDRGIVEIFP